MVKIQPNQQFPASTILSKTSNQKWKTKQTWAEEENFDISFFVIFDRFWQNFIPGGVIGC